MQKISFRRDHPRHTPRREMAVLLIGLVVAMGLATIPPRSNAATAPDGRAIVAPLGPYGERAV